MATPVISCGNFPSILLVHFTGWVNTREHDRHFADHRSHFFYFLSCSEITEFCINFIEILFRAPISNGSDKLMCQAGDKPSHEAVMPYIVESYMGLRRVYYGEFNIWWIPFSSYAYMLIKSDAFLPRALTGYCNLHIWLMIYYRATTPFYITIKQFVLL